MDDHKYHLLVVCSLASWAGDSFHQLSVQYAELGSTMVSYEVIYCILVL